MRYSWKDGADFEHSRHYDAYFVDFLIHMKSMTYIHNNFNPAMSKSESKTPSSALEKKAVFQNSNYSTNIFFQR